MSESESFAEANASESGKPLAEGAAEGKAPARKRAPRKAASPAKKAVSRTRSSKKVASEDVAPVDSPAPAPSAAAPIREAAPAEEFSPPPAPVVREESPSARDGGPAPAEGHPGALPGGHQPSGQGQGGQGQQGGGRKRNRKRRRNKGNREFQNEGGERPAQDFQRSGEEEGDFDEIDGSDDDPAEGADGVEGSGEGGEPRVFKTRKQRYLERKEKERARELAALESSPAVESEGIVEISPKGFGFLRARIRGFQQSPKDVFITPEVVRIYGLRDGHMVRCVSKMGIRGPQLIELLAINGNPPEDCARLPYFEELTAINPNKKLTLETEQSRLTTRVIDLVAPIGRGQRGLIVAPPRTGKTTFLHHIAEGLLKNYDDEIHLMVLLVDERPEEVTDFERSFPDVEVFSSSNDSEAKDHTRIALLAIERAKRLVEGGRHVVMLMDSITRLARAFNSQMRGGGKRGTASGGLIVGALEVPRRIFAAARNTREAGSLTIIATALVQTNSKADEAIFQEFKGTGNMELVLDRQLAQNYIYPAVDINKSGTRREELLLPPHMLEKIYVIRRGLSGYRPADAMEWLIRCMNRYPSNAQMLMDIKVTALA
ncbi:MAG: transcription termination factor Rho [Verrucomicrobiales bacterium]|nr:transcription termination factor Rho [Verrucomicrobiales bacterium]